MTERHFTVVGPSNSGKTTYFAALYFLLKNADDQYAFRLDRKYEIQNRAYLNEISEDWANLRKIKHTDSGQWEPLELPLVNHDESQRLVLLIPDLAGEFFNNTLTSRTWDEKVAKQLAQSDGFLLFINVKDYRSVELMDEQWAARIEPLSGTEKQAQQVDATPWEPDAEKIPSDVFYTDLIQQVYYQDSEKRHRVAIVLSAWDIIQNSKDQENPKAYFEKRFPLLAQFLSSRDDQFQTAFFGVSAYGANQDEQTEVKSLENCEPHERVIVFGSTGKGHDITLPLMHLMSHE